MANDAISNDRCAIVVGGVRGAERRNEDAKRLQLLTSAHRRRRETPRALVMRDGTETGNF